MPPDVVRDNGSAQSSKVSWFELFYDLVIVAAVALVNDAFLREPSLATAREALIGFVALSWVWFLTVVFANVFPGQDLVRRVLMVVQMALVVAAALTIERSLDEVGRTVMLAYAGAIGVVAVLIVSDRWLVGDRRPPAPPALAAPVAVSAVVIAAGGLLGQPFLVPSLVIGLLVSVVAVLAWQYPTWRGDERLRLPHLRERLGLFILIILGEGFAQLVNQLGGIGEIPRAGMFALLFLVSFALWWIYFDGTFTEETDLSRVMWRLSLLGHLLLVIGMAGTLDILVLLTVSREADVGAHIFEYFAFCVALTLLSFALLRFAATRRVGASGGGELVSAGIVIAIGIGLGEGGIDELFVLIGVSAALIVANAGLAVWSGRRSDGTLASRFGVLIRGDST